MVSLVSCKKLLPLSIGCKKITALINILSLNSFHIGIKIYPANNLLHNCQMSLIREISFFSTLMRNIISNIIEFQYHWIHNHILYSYILTKISMYEILKYQNFIYEYCIPKILNNYRLHTLNTNWHTIYLYLDISIRI